MSDDFSLGLSRADSSNLVKRDISKSETETLFCSPLKLFPKLIIAELVNGAPDHHLLQQIHPHVDPNEEILVTHKIVGGACCFVPSLTRVIISVLGYHARTFPICSSETFPSRRVKRCFVVR